MSSLSEMFILSLYSYSRIADVGPGRAHAGPIKNLKKSTKPALPKHKSGYATGYTAYVATYNNNYLFMCIQHRRLCSHWRSQSY